MATALTDAPLPLASARWATLTQAYGDARDVPALLAALGTVDDPGARAEFWFALWRLLLRPDTASDASYAAAPHLLRIAADFDVEERAEALHLVTRIEIARRAPNSSPVPDDLLPAYAAAIESLAGHVADCAREPWSAEVARICAAALVVGKRHPDLARPLLDGAAGEALPERSGGVRR